MNKPPACAMPWGFACGVVGGVDCLGGGGRMLGGCLRVLDNRVEQHGMTFRWRGWPFVEK